MPVKLGKPIPRFSADATGGVRIQSSSYKGRQLILYFYSRDNTAGCTSEAIAFRDKYGEFAKVNTVLLGISRDSLKSHDTFRAKFDLPFDLISDADETICTLFDVIKPKKMYGKEVVGVERSTFLVDAGGILRQEWRKVKVAGHVDEVLEAARRLYETRQTAE